jgi:DNA invertase Pin-like site-specific DNA recombinase
MTAKKGRRIGYARVSSKDQNLTIQREALEKADCAIVLEEKITGTKRDGREQLDIALKILEAGDQLVVLRLDRLGRSMRDLANIAHELEKKKAELLVLEQNVDTTTPTGRALYGMLSVFAQFETDVRRARQLDGIARVKRDRELSKKTGRYKYAGGTARISVETIKAEIASGKGPSAVAKQLGISRMSVYRAMQA